MAPKSNAKKPGKIRTITFGKKKIKLGKTLKRDNVTDVSFKTQKIVLLEQLKSQDGDAILSYRGLNLEDLCRQLSHYNDNIRRSAIIGVKQLLTSHPNHIPKHLRTIIPAMGHLISAGVKNQTTREQLKCLIKVICSISSEIMSSYFELFSTHILTGLTDIRQEVRYFAFDILLLIAEHFPDLCAKRRNIYEQYLIMIGSQRKPTNLTLIEKSKLLFRNVYENSTLDSFLETQTRELESKTEAFESLKRILPNKRKFFVPIIYE